MQHDRKWHADVAEWFINSYSDNAVYSQVMCDDSDICMHLFHSPI